MAGMALPKLTWKSSTPVTNSSPVFFFWRTNWFQASFHSQLTARPGKQQKCRATGCNEGLITKIYGWNIPSKLVINVPPFRERIQQFPCSLFNVSFSLFRVSSLFPCSFFNGHVSVFSQTPGRLYITHIYMEVPPGCSTPLLHLSSTNFHRNDSPFSNLN